MSIIDPNLPPLLPPPPPGEDPACPQLRMTKISQQATLDSLNGQLFNARVQLLINQRVAVLDDPTGYPRMDPWTKEAVQARRDQIGADPTLTDAVMVYGLILVNLGLLETLPGQIQAVQQALQGTLSQMETKGCTQ